MALHKQKNILYVDTDKKYHFIVGEMVKGVGQVHFSDNINDALYIFEKNIARYAHSLGVRLNCLVVNLYIFEKTSRDMLRLDRMSPNALQGKVPKLWS